MRTIRSNALLRKGILNAGRRAQRLGAIHTFPRQIDVRSAEMAERGRLTINRAAQIQSMMPAGRRSNCSLTIFASASSEMTPVPCVSTSRETGLATPIA